MQELDLYENEVIVQVSGFSDTEMLIGDGIVPWSNMPLKRNFCFEDLFCVIER